MKLIPQYKRHANTFIIYIRFSLFTLVLGIAAGCGSSTDKIATPNDAPKPLSPKESLKSFKLPPGFRIELVASEPLISEPTGVCWDANGWLFVSELHGYNLEGQLEIEAMNKTGVLDTVVQRVQAADQYKEEAKAGTFGRVKLLSDTDGDGIMDHAEVFAEGISPAYGLCASLEGLIVAGQTEIIYLADKDKDGKAEVIDTLFTGFQGGALERGTNAPQWGPDGWIYFGKGWNGGLITGPNLKTPVQLPGSNFRIRPDGTAIEPITGSTHTIGHAFTEDGYSLFTSTWKHALYAIPIPWQYLTRNPDASISSLEADASDFSTVFPIAPVHPWKLARSNQPGWKDFYGSMGLSEGAEAGYFTSCCSPLVYQDNIFPEEYYGNLFVCEPAQCLVHRSIVEPDGTGLKVRRAATEQDKEFLASSDSWFRPVSLTYAPDGSLYIIDMYREIIEDYSAVPRFMQQLYGLSDGIDRGRIWRVSPTNANQLASMERVDMTQTKLKNELDSPHYWRRQTADRLLRERATADRSGQDDKRLKLVDLSNDTQPVDFIFALRAQDALIQTNVALARKLAKMISDITDERMLLQLALSLGYSQDAEVFNAIINMARDHADIRWMPDAIMTGVNERSGNMLAALLENPGTTGESLIEPLAASISARRDSQELGASLKAIANTSNTLLQAAALKGINTNIKVIPLSNTGKSAVNTLLNDEDLAVRGHAIRLAGKLNIGDTKALDVMHQQAASEVANPELETDLRLAAVGLLADAPDEFASSKLVEAFSNATPPVKSAILDALILRGERIQALTEALENGTISATALTSLQHTQLLERADHHLRPRLESLFNEAVDPDKETTFLRYAALLSEGKNMEHGGELFQQMCASCHRVNEIGKEVGPDLKLAYQNSSETLLRSILWPSEIISSSYETYVVTTNENQIYSGVLVNESANSVVLRQAGGTELTFLRKDIKKFSSSEASLMPNYAQALSPEDCADIISWLRNSLTVN